ncbi:MAG: FecR domain-containing protein [Rhodospirillaceae bacterium]|nr:FecR domain-containing protein [Rhodospirillaceae bacterium]
MLHRSNVAILSLCLGLAAPIPAAMANAIGVVAQVATHSERTPASGAEVALAPEDEIFPDDLIVTDGRGAARLDMADDTVITVGPASQVSLDRFLYDPATNSGDVVTRISAGGMRFISGDLPSESYSIATPVAVIGLRGTDVTVLVNPETLVTRVIVLVGEVAVRPTGCDYDIPVRAGRMVDIAPIAACGQQEQPAVPLPQWARGRLFPIEDTVVVINEILSDDTGDGNPGGNPGGTPGGDTRGGEVAVGGRL